MKMIEWNIPEFKSKNKSKNKKAEGRMNIVINVKNKIYIMNV